MSYTTGTAPDDDDVETSICAECGWWWPLFEAPDLSEMFGVEITDQQATVLWQAAICVHQIVKHPVTYEAATGKTAAYASHRYERELGDLWVLLRDAA